jgi:hypothetical protein
MRQPALGLLELCLQARQGNVGRHRGADRLPWHGSIAQRLPQEREALEGPPQGRTGALDRRIEVLLGPAIRGGHQFMVHVHQVVDGLVVCLAEETHQARIVLWCVEEAQTMGTRLPDLPD